MTKEIQFVDLGWTFAKIAKFGDTQSFLYFVCPSSEGEIWSPAQSITIEGRDEIIALRDALNSMFPLKTSK